MAQDRESREERRARKAARRAQEAAPLRLDPAKVLGDIDAWNLREDGGWLRFDARLEDGPRAYLRPRNGGDILADAPGPLLAVLGIGGARRAGFNAGPPRFRWNILAPGDHIGGVGLEGTALATRVSHLHHIPHRSHEALVAEALLSHRYATRRGLPLIMVRAETDASASVRALSGGMAFSNFCTALDNLVAAAASLGRRAQVLAVGLEFGAEDLTSGPDEFAAGMRALMARISDKMAERGLLPPVFLAAAGAGGCDHAALRGWWHLGWSPGPHRLILSAPGYMAAPDPQGRVTDTGRDTLARMDAQALLAQEAGEDWLCPLPLLAEHHGTELRVTFRAMGPLVLDAIDPFGVGPAAGFTITDTDTPVAITEVAVAADDPQSLILTLDRAIIGRNPRLLLACGSVMASRIRDDWVADDLHRWAIPADLPIHPQGTPT